MAESGDPVIVGGWSGSEYRRLSPWKRFTAALPMRSALTGVALVWLLGCVWSFEEQTNFAAAKGFTLPWLLPLVIDGLAAAMAGVAYAASLDARPAIPARIATALAVAASATSNGAWAYERAGTDAGTVALAVGIPVAANLAFEVLLSELRRQIQRRRGQRPPVAIPYPRIIRIALSPFKTFVTWRRLVLEITDPRREIEPMTPVPAVEAAAAVRVPVRAGPADGTDPPTARMPRIRPEPAQQLRAEVDRGSRPRRPVLATAATSNGGRSNGGRSNGGRTMGGGTIGGNGFDARVLRVTELIRGGEDLTGDAVGEMFGCSARTGRRLLAQGVELASRRNGNHEGATGGAPDAQP
ncbi:MAG: hypothetical protein JWR88_610 [Pseudonocardia sp.]|nr:hypothetical protein [Pseudonocardia sp.]